LHRLAISAFAFMLATAVLPIRAQDYAQERQAYKTRLLRTGPSPQPYEAVRLPENVEAIGYPSGTLRLKGWLVTPKKLSAPLVSIIYLHGGFAFGDDDYKLAQPFIDAGYPVMFPLLRGENGNPGNFELMYGEVEDALAAARWLSTTSKVRSTKVAFFGHSVGGAVSELTSLWNAESVLLSGSTGALYPPEVFQGWGAMVPFDATSRKEVIFRSFVSNLPSMKRRHVAYIGSEEPQARLVKRYRDLATTHNAPLSITVVPGNHETSIAPAMRAFLAELQKPTLK